MLWTTSRYLPMSTLAAWDGGMNRYKASDKSAEEL